MTTNEFIERLMECDFEWIMENQMPFPSLPFIEYTRNCMKNHEEGKPRATTDKKFFVVTFPQCQGLDIEDTIIELTNDFTPSKCQRLRQRILEAIPTHQTMAEEYHLDRLCEKYKEVWGEDAPLTKALRLLDEHCGPVAYETTKYIKKDERGTYDTKVYEVLIRLHGLLLKRKKIPEGTTPMKLTKAFINADLRDFYVDGTKAPFRYVICKMKDQFTEDWFKDTYTTLGETYKSIYSHHLGEETATELWEKDMCKVITGKEQN